MVALDSAMRWAICTWVRVSCWTVTSPLLPAGRAAGAGEAELTSALTIRPPGPDPDSCERSMPASRAIRRASGEAFTRPLSARSRGGETGASPLPEDVGGAGTRRSRLPADTARSGAADTPASPMRAISSPMRTVCPSATRIRSVPSASASKVTVALSVSTSASGSPSDTSSPSDFSQRTIVPSSIESDRRGMTTSGMTPLQPALSTPARSRTAATIASVSGMNASSSVGL